MADCIAQASGILGHTTWQQLFFTGVACPDNRAHVGMTGVEKEFEVITTDSFGYAFDLAGSVEPEARLEFPYYQHPSLGSFFRGRVPGFNQLSETSLILYIWQFFRRTDRVHPESFDTTLLAQEQTLAESFEIGFSRHLVGGNPCEVRRIAGNSQAVPLIRSSSASSLCYKLQPFFIKYFDLICFSIN